MCGLSGFVAREGYLLSDSLILSMNNIIHHRGPDDEGFVLFKRGNEIVIAGGDNTGVSVWTTQTTYSPMIHINNCLNGSSILALGHKRLSILDLSPAGHQPMTDCKKRFWIVYNGEIYNYLEIKAELEQIGFSFKTRTDTEVIIAAYAHWGKACLDRFVGMWAFAIYDQEKNEIFLARDRYGIKPLYYYFSSEGDFFFASEIKQFTTLSCWTAKLNPDRVYDQLIYSFTDHTNETMFAGIFQLPGGAFYKSELNKIIPNDKGQIRYERWYHQKRQPFKGSFVDAALTFRELFERSVKEHLNADVPVGTALSGGLDSSSIVCEVNRLLKTEGYSSLQRTFSSCSTYEKYSERKWMDVVVNHTKIDAKFVYPELKEVFNLTNDVLWHQDEPYQSQSAFLAFRLFMLARSNGVKVLLNGQGADEYLGGYGQFTLARLAKMTTQFRFLALINEMSEIRKNNETSYSTLIFGTVGHLLPYSVKNAITRFRSSSDHIKRIVNNKILKANAIHPYELIPIYYRTVPEISKHLTFFSTLPKYLHWEDRNSMANSVEARVPFLDHRLVEFAYNLPDDFLEKDGVRKKIMRQAMIDLLPEQIRNRRDKMGFTTPEENWVKKEDPKLFRSKISDAIEVTNGIIKPEALEYFDNVVSGKTAFDFTYWRIILFSEWIKRFNIEI